jgi:uncharacterized membrane protein HdeD (DUF308 family)
MSTQTPAPPPAPGAGERPLVAGFVEERLKDVRDSWFWFVLLGAALIALGVGALTYTGMVVATAVTVLVFGCLLAAGGIAYIVGAFFTRGWGGFFLSLLAGVLYVAAGVIIISDPVEAAIIYTLLLAMFFFVEGLFRIISALTGRFRQRGWMLVNGIVTLILGVLIWRQWPLSGLYAVGMLLGVNLVFSGVSYVGLGLAARRLPVA